MANKGIDFLKGQKTTDLKKERTLLFLKVGSLVFIIFYSLLVGGVFFLNIYFQKENQNIVSQIEAKKKRISELKKIESLQLILKQRLTFLNKLFSEGKTDYFQIFSYLENLSLPGIVFTELATEGKGGIKISGEASSAVDLSNFLEKLNSPTNQFFSKIILSSSSRQEDGSYKFSLSCVL